MACFSFGANTGAIIFQGTSPGRNLTENHSEIDEGNLLQRKLESRGSKYIAAPLLDRRGSGSHGVVTLKDNVRLIGTGK